MTDWTHPLVAGLRAYQDDVVWEVVEAEIPPGTPWLPVKAIERWIDVYEREQQTRARLLGLCCTTHREPDCCDPDDCGPCCPDCPTCPTLNPAKENR